MTTSFDSRRHNQDRWYAANAFIFPNLDSGNLGDKIAERTGSATALGLLQGLAKPANDLSRNCSVNDIRQLIAITGAQAALHGHHR